MAIPNKHVSPAAAAGPANRWYGLLFLSLSLLVISLDNTILNVALPSIARRFHASATMLQWVVDAYILVFASLLLSMGAIGDRLGRKRVLQLGLVLFGAGSLAATRSTSAVWLVAARAFLGIAGATIMPATLSCIVAMFPRSDERRKAIALWAATFGLGVALGPLIGGALLTRFDWSAAFYVNLPVVVIAVVGCQMHVTESRDSRVRPLDIPGLLLSITGLFALVYGIIEASGAESGAPGVRNALATAVVLLGAFVFWEMRHPHPMLPLGLFRNRYFAGSNLALVFVFFANYGSVFFLSQYFQSVQGYAAFRTGLLLLPMAFMATIGSGMSARLGGRLGPRITVSIGMGLAATGLLLVSRIVTSQTPYVQLLPWLSVFSFGLGLAIPAATNTVMGVLPLDKAGIGSGLNDTTRQVGGALGVAVLGTIMNHQFLRGLDGTVAGDLLRSGQETLARSGIQGAHAAAQALPARLAEPLLAAANRAFSTGMASAMRTGGIILALGTVAVYFLIPGQRAELSGE